MWQRSEQIECRPIATEPVVFIIPVVKRRRLKIKTQKIAQARKCIGRPTGEIVVENAESAEAMLLDKVRDLAIRILPGRNCVDGRQRGSPQLRGKPPAWIPQQVHHLQIKIVLARLAVLAEGKSGNPRELLGAVDQACGPQSLKRIVERAIERDRVNVMKDWAGLRSGFAQSACYMPRHRERAVVFPEMGCRCVRPQHIREPRGTRLPFAQNENDRAFGDGHDWHDCMTAARGCAGMRSH